MMTMIISIVVLLLSLLAAVAILNKKQYEGSFAYHLDKIDIFDMTVFIQSFIKDEIVEYSIRFPVALFGHELRPQETRKFIKQYDWIPVHSEGWHKLSWTGEERDTESIPIKWEKKWMKDDDNV